VWNLVHHSQIPLNASAYEFSRGMPDEKWMLFMWVGWVIVSFIAAVASASIFAGILFSREARGSAFNMYLLALTIPDFVISSSCTITCWLNYNLHFYVGNDMCRWQAFYASFGIAGSFYLNALVAHEMRRLLKATKRLEDYHPPSHRRVLLTSAGVLVFCVILSTIHMWGIFSLEAFPTYGIVCVVHDKTVPSTLAMWLIYMPLIAFLPCAYIFYVAINSWWNNLIYLRAPPLAAEEEAANESPEMDSVAEMQRRMHIRRIRQARTLGLYFARIFLSVLLMWAPASVFLITLKLHSAWGVWVGGTWGHLQGLASALMCLTKPDVFDAVKDLYTCRRRPPPQVAPPRIVTKSASCLDFQA